MRLLAILSTILIITNFVNSVSGIDACQGKPGHFGSVSCVDTVHDPVAGLGQESGVDSSNLGDGTEKSANNFDDLDEFFLTFMLFIGTGGAGFEALHPALFSGRSTVPEHRPPNRMVLALIQ